MTLFLLSLSNGTLILNNCTFAFAGSNVVGTVNNHINTVNEMSPELANILTKGLNYPEIHDKLIELIEEIATIKSDNSRNKPGLAKRIIDKLDDVRKVSVGTGILTSYGKDLYKVAKPFITAHTGIHLPDWQ